jgi:hypothetical protein
LFDRPKPTAGCSASGRRRRRSRRRRRRRRRRRMLQGNKMPCWTVKQTTYFNILCFVYVMSPILFVLSLVFRRELGRHSCVTPAVRRFGVERRVLE